MQHLASRHYIPGVYKYVHSSLQKHVRRTGQPGTQLVDGMSHFMQNKPHIHHHGTHRAPYGIWNFLLIRNYFEVFIY